MARTSTTTSRLRKTGSKSAAQLPEGRSKWELDELRELFVDSEMKKKELRWWFDVGHQVLRLNPTLVRGGKATEGLARSVAADKLEKATDTQSTRILENATFVLRLARKLAVRFESWEKLVKFQGNRKLSIWHVMSLLAVDEKKNNTTSMEDFRDACVAEGWSVRRLRHEIQSDKGRKQTGGRPRMPLKVTAPAVAVQELCIAARHWMAYHDECLGGRTPVLTRTRGVRFDKRLLDSVKTAVDELEKVKVALADELAQLNDLSKAIKTALK